MWEVKRWSDLESERGKDGKKENLMEIQLFRKEKGEKKEGGKKERKMAKSMWTAEHSLHVV